MVVGHYGVLHTSRPGLHTNTCQNVTANQSNKTMRVIPKFAPVLFVWVEALRLSQLFFSHVGTEPPLPGYHQYFWGGKCILLKDTTRRPE